MSQGMRSERSITVVVPLVPAHDKFVPELIEQLSSERNVIASVILARSSARKRNLRNLQLMIPRLQSDHGLEIQVLATRQQQLAGQNRNRGWGNAHTPFTAFLDADDEYATDRLSRLLEVAESEASDLVLHDFMLKELETDQIPATSWTMQDLVRTDELYDATFAQGRDRMKEGLTPGDTNVIVPSSSTEYRSVHHGHVLVRTNLRRTFRYSTLYPGEDGQFCRDVLWGGGNVTYVPARLSAYRPKLSAEMDSSFLFKVRRRIRRLGRRMLVHS